MAVVAGSCPFPGDNAAAFHDFARGGRGAGTQTQGGAGRLVRALSHAAPVPHLTGSAKTARGVSNGSWVFPGVQRQPVAADRPLKFFPSQEGDNLKKGCREARRRSRLTLEPFRTALAALRWPEKWLYFDTGRSVPLG